MLLIILALPSNCRYVTIFSISFPVKPKEKCMLELTYSLAICWRILFLAANYENRSQDSRFPEQDSNPRLPECLARALNYWCRYSVLRRLIRSDRYHRHILWWYNIPQTLFFVDCVKFMAQRPPSPPPPDGTAVECSNSWANKDYLLPVDHITRHKKVTFPLIRFRDPRCL
jgi:hypothetical protein